MSSQEPMRRLRSRSVSLKETEPELENGGAKNKASSQPPDHDHETGPAASAAARILKQFKFEPAKPCDQIVTLDPPKSDDLPPATAVSTKSATDHNGFHESTEDTKKTIPIDDFIKGNQKWGALACSGNLPKRKLKGVWVIDGLETAIEDGELKAIESPEFKLPNGNSMKLSLNIATRTSLKHDAIGLFFLNMGPEVNTLLGLSMYVKITSAKSRHRKKNKYVAYYSTEKTFDEIDRAWGNAKFIAKEELTRHKLGEVLRIQFSVKCLVPPKDPPQGVSAGLINHGTTCYANSLLQTFNSVKEFRRAVFAIPTADDEAAAPEYALQRLLYNLQTSAEPVGTKELLFALGWKDDELYVQHDIQEFKCILCNFLEKMEPRLDNTPYQSAFKRLYEGKVTNSIQCLDVDCSSSRTETFADIPLNVRHCQNVYESFDQYLAQEELSGDNKYYADDKGLQRATRSVRFDSLPLVLHLHLKRFDYSSASTSKINDFYSFDDVIDLSKYCQDTSSPYKYKLHAVVVHRGDPHSGHYFTYVYEAGKWIKYDDKHVKEVEPREAIDENFGGTYDTILVDSKTGDIVKERKEIASSAYLLVYIRLDEYSKIQTDLTENDIPAFLRKRFEKETQLFALQKKEADNLDNAVPVYIVTPEMIKGWDRNNIGPGTEKSKDIPEFQTNPRYRLRVLADPNLSLNDFLTGIADQLSASLDALSVWLFEINKYGLSFLPRQKLDLDMKLKELKTDNERKKAAGKQRGLFLSYTGEAEDRPICERCSEEDTAKRQEQLNELETFFKTIKRDDYADSLDQEIPQWKLIKDSGASISTLPVTSSSDSSTENVPRLLFIKFFDPLAPSLVLLRSMILPSDKSLSVVESYVREQCNIKDQEIQMCIELSPADGSYHKTTKKLDKAVTMGELKEVAIILCAMGREKAEGETEVLKVEKYLKELLPQMFVACDTRHNTTANFGNVVTFDKD